MAAVTNTYQTFTAKGLRESLSNVIYDISPTDTPYMNSIGRGESKASLEEWQTDALDAAVTTNAQIQGDDITSFPAQTPTTRLGNYHQISRKLVLIAGTLEAVDKAGRKSEMAYQKAKKSKEIKRDIEATLVSNQAASAGDTTTAATTAGFLAWVKSNVNKASDGSDPVYTTIPTDPRNDGTARSFSEAILKDVIAQGWEEGAEFKMVMLGAFNKQVASTFAGVATKTKDQSANRPAAIIASADVYVSDFGTLYFVPNRFQRGRDALFVDPAYAKVSFLRPFAFEKLAKTGDAEKTMLIVEWMHKILNEKALGLAADLTTS